MRTLGISGKEESISGAEFPAAQQSHTEIVYLGVMCIFFGKRHLHEVSYSKVLAPQI